MVYVYIISFIPVFLWSLAYWPIIDRFSDSFTTLLSLGQVSSLIGLCFYSVSLILSTRPKFLENSFGGLNQIYKKHHLIGGLSFILMMLHPLFLLFSRISISFDYARNLIIPGNDFYIDLGIIALCLIMTLLIITFYTKLPYQIWKLTHKLTGYVFLIAVFHSFLIPSTISQYKPLWYYMLLICGLGIISFLYRTVFFKLFVKKYKYSVSKVKKLTKNVVEITLTPETNDKIKYFPGQFLFVSFTSSVVSDEFHPYSIASANTDDIVIISKIEGDYTKLLMDLEAGSKALVEGAFGRFSYHYYPNPKQIWIGGGIGITPFIGMAKGIEKDQGFSTDLYCCYKDESEKIGIPIKSANLKIFYSKTMGHISADYIKNNSKYFELADFFVCGPPPLMKSIRDQLVKLDVKKSRIHTEEFTFD
jgi:predicted ferric reductase